VHRSCIGARALAGRPVVRAAAGMRPPELVSGLRPGGPGATYRAAALANGPDCLPGQQATSESLAGSRATGISRPRSAMISLVAAARAPAGWQCWVSAPGEALLALGWRKRLARASAPQGARLGELLAPFAKPWLRLWDLRALVIVRWHGHLCRGESGAISPSPVQVRRQTPLFWPEPA